LDGGRELAGGALALRAPSVRKPAVPRHLARQLSQTARHKPRDTGDAAARTRTPRIYVVPTQKWGDRATHTSTSTAHRPPTQPASNRPPAPPPIGRPALPAELPLFSDDQQVHAISVTELSRAVSATIERAISGDRVIITKHGVPVAVIVSLTDALEGLIAGSESFALLRCEARAQLDRGEAVALPSWRSEPE
jgi:prevent-host-death family protein